MELKLSTSFPGYYLFLPRGRKREDPGNQVANDDKRLSDETQINILFKSVFIIKFDISAMLTT